MQVQYYAGSTFTICPPGTFQAVADKAMSTIGSSQAASP
jgi:hypothetical protein